MISSSKKEPMSCNALWLYGSTFCEVFAFSGEKASSESYSRTARNQI